MSSLSQRHPSSTIHHLSSTTNHPTSSTHHSASADVNVWDVRSMNKDEIIFIINNYFKQLLSGHDESVDLKDVLTGIREEHLPLVIQAIYTAFQPILHKVTTSDTHNNNVAVRRILDAICHLSSSSAEIAPHLSPLITIISHTIQSSDDGIRAQSIKALDQLSSGYSAMALTQSASALSVFFKPLFQLLGNDNLNTKTAAITSIFNIIQNNPILSKKESKKLIPRLCYIYVKIDDDDNIKAVIINIINLLLSAYNKTEVAEEEDFNQHITNMVAILGPSLLADLERVHLSSAIRLINLFIAIGNNNNNNNKKNTYANSMNSINIDIIEYFKKCRQLVSWSINDHESSSSTFKLYKKLRFLLDDSLAIYDSMSSDSSNRDIANAKRGSEDKAVEGSKENVSSLLNTPKNSKYMPKTKLKSKSTTDSNVATTEPFVSATQINQSVAVDIVTSENSIATVLKHQPPTTAQHPLPTNQVCFDDLLQQQHDLMIIFSEFSSKIYARLNQLENLISSQAIENNNNNNNKNNNSVTSNRSSSNICNTNDNCTISKSEIVDLFMASVNSNDFLELILLSNRHGIILCDMSKLQMRQMIDAVLKGISLGFCIDIWLAWLDEAVILFPVVESENTDIQLLESVRNALTDLLASTDLNDNCQAIVLDLLQKFV